VPKLAVQSEDLRSQSAEVKHGASDVHDTLSRLTSQIADLASRWEGGASQAFQNRWTDWQQGATQVQEAMDAMGEFLAKAAEAYEDTEESLKSAAGG
jgi:WXG100 family type VII secretion target